MTIDFSTTDLAEVRRAVEQRAADLTQALSESGRHPRGLDVVRGCDVQVEPIRWLWSGWLAAGKLHVLAGAPGTGKTTIAMELAAKMTVGGCWPDGTPSPPGEVAIWSGEDDPGDTLAPRMLAAGADMEKVHFIRGMNDEDGRRSFDPALDMPYLRLYLSEHPAIRLLIVDPVVSAVSGDSHKNTEVRRGLQPLVDLAAATGCAVVGISHFSKGTSGRDPLERVTGSIAFGALARVVWAAAKLADDENGKRLFARAKSNIGPDSGGWHYTLDTVELTDRPGIVTSRVMWCGEVEGSARELLDTAETSEAVEEKGARAEAMEFLTDILSDGPLPAKKIFAVAKENGVSEKTLRRAKTSLGIKPEKVGMAGGWQWALPGRWPQKTEEAQQNCMDSFGKSGHLRPENNQDQEILTLTADDFEGGLFDES